LTDPTVAPIDLDAWLEHVQTHGIKLGLTNTRRALNALGDPQRSYPSILVGGTNGKGSTVAFATAVLAAAGHRVGSTISPHLTAYRERFRIDGVPVSEEVLRDHAAHVHAVLTPIPELAQLTFFELGASMALSLFAAEAVDVAVVEVGMGGEFDATRGSDPVVGVVVSVDEDHLAHLGPTVQDVARTKARIAPPGGVLVTGESREDRLHILREEVAALECCLWEQGREYTYSGTDEAFSYRGQSFAVSDVRLGLLGPHQAQNAACALAAVEALVLAVGLALPSEQAIAHALAATRLAGRLESVPSDGVRPRYLLDGAHNPAGAQALCRALTRRSRSGKRWWLLATKRDKRLGDVLDLLLPLVDGVVCTRGTTSDKFVPPEEIAERVQSHDHGRLTVLVAADPAVAVETAHSHLGPDDEVLVAGSLYLVGDVRPLLGLPVS
jgi:dihydrofolate synthase/folylpolyglutamate synthase